MLRNTWIVLGAVGLITIANVTAFAVDEVHQPVVGDGAAGGAAEPTTWTVCSSGCDFTSIQAAVSAARDGDTIELGAETFIENVEIARRNDLTVTGQGTGQTVIYGYIQAVITWGLAISNVTVVGAYSSAATIDFWLGFEPIIDKCEIVGGRVGINCFNCRGLVVSASSVSRARDWGIIAGFGGLIVRSTVSENGSGISGAWSCNDPYPGCYDWPYTVRNSTVVNNSGSGISAAERAEIVASTIVNNRVGISNSPDVVAATIVASNERNCFGPLRSGGFNIIDDESCGALGPSDQIGIDPLLLPLANNGGPTPTHALTPGSPAIDAGGDDCLPTDQRGVARPQDGDGDGVASCDIGAYEVDVLTVTIDIKPDGYPNSLNPYARGVIPVATLGSDTFDVADIDVTTLGFGPDGASVAHINGHLQDVNYDGIIDLMTHYQMRDSGIECGDELAALTGETLDGQTIEGSDSIQTVGCRSSRWPAFGPHIQYRLEDPGEGEVVEIERR